RRRSLGIGGSLDRAGVAVAEHEEVPVRYPVTAAAQWRHRTAGRRFGHRFVDGNDVLLVGKPGRTGRHDHLGDRIDRYLRRTGLKWLDGSSGYRRDHVPAKGQD